MVSYAHDAEWLRWSTATIEKNLKGYRRIIVVAPKQDRKFFDPIAKQRVRVTMKYIEDWPGKGYYWQQNAKVFADHYSDADFIVHIDSDVFIKEPCSIDDFFSPDGKRPGWLYSKYSEVAQNATVWQKPTERASGLPCPEELMAAFPFVIDRRTYAVCRTHLEKTSGRTTEQYIREAAPEPGQPPGFSEFNFMGRIAREKQASLYHWVDRNHDEWPVGFHHTRQFWSHAPLADCLSEIQQMIHGGSAQNIRVTNRGHWILSNDTHISKWVEDSGRLDHDTETVANLCRYIKPGDTVVDVGAFIGDHTVAYAHATHGVDSGRVIAFEPNRAPFECLKRNMAGLVHVECVNAGLSDKPGTMSVAPSENAGASHLIPGGDIPIIRLDDRKMERLDFLKIDAEGMEAKILDGAADTIARCKPTMYIEVNDGALQRQGSSAEQLIRIVRSLGYRVNGAIGGPQFDILCTPANKSAANVIVALGVCDKDVHLARLWLHWVSFLCTQEGGDNSKLTLVVNATRRVTDAQINQLSASLVQSPGMFKVVFVKCPDEQEAGYPGSASHLFLRTLEAANLVDPSAAILWCETDTVAMRPSWVHDIISEYASCGMPFMGDRAGPNADSHMTGNAIYPHNWRQLAPLIVDSARPGPPAFEGHVNGLAWDVHAQSQITPRMHACQTIHQIWRPAPFHPGNLDLIRPEAALFHQCKTGDLILALAQTRYPDFLKARANSRYFMISGREMFLPGGPKFIKFDACHYNVGVGWEGVYESTTLVEEIILLHHADLRRSVSEISRDDFMKLKALKPSLRLHP